MPRDIAVSPGSSKGASVGSPLSFVRRPAVLWSVAPPRWGARSGSSGGFRSRRTS
jgi:hypothetical protein